MESRYEENLHLNSEALLLRMRTLNKKFKNACTQVILLNNQIEYLQVRYDSAVYANKRTYKYFLRLRLATLEGIRNMFYEYACRKADELDIMQDQLIQHGVIDSDYDMEDPDSYSAAEQAGTATIFGLPVSQTTHEPDTQTAQNVNSRYRSDSQPNEETVMVVNDSGIASGTENYHPDANNESNPM